MVPTDRRSVQGRPETQPGMLIYQASNTKPVPLSLISTTREKMHLCVCCRFLHLHKRKCKHFKWNENDIFIDDLLLKHGDMSEEQLNSNLSPPPAQTRQREITLPQDLVKHTSEPQIYILMKTIAIFTYLEPC